MSPSTSPSQSPAAPVELELRVQGSRGPVNQRYLFVNALLVANDELVQVVVDITELPVFGLSAGAVLRIEAVEEPSRTRQGLRGFQAVRLLQLRPPVNGTAENAAAVKKAHCTGAPSLCKFWVRRGQCGTLGCTFRHGALSQTEEEAVRARRQQVRVAVDADDPHAADDKRQHARRHAVFADWLLSTFGRDALDGGGGVLDIAGGRGALAFEVRRSWWFTPGARATAPSSCFGACRGLNLLLRHAGAEVMCSAAGCTRSSYHARRATPSSHAHGAPEEEAAQAAGAGAGGGAGAGARLGQRFTTGVHARTRAAGWRVCRCRGGSRDPVQLLGAGGAAPRPGDGRSRGCRRAIRQAVRRGAVLCVPVAVSAATSVRVLLPRATALRLVTCFAPPSPALPHAHVTQLPLIRVRRPWRTLHLQGGRQHGEELRRAVRLPHGARGGYARGVSASGRPQSGPVSHRSHRAAAQQDARRRRTRLRATERRAAATCGRWLKLPFDGKAAAAAAAAAVQIVRSRAGCKPDTPYASGEPGRTSDRPLRHDGVLSHG
jgi:hypothetical protein